METFGEFVQLCRGLALKIAGKLSTELLLRVEDSLVSMHWIIAGLTESRQFLSIRLMCFTPRHVEGYFCSRLGAASSIHLLMGAKIGSTGFESAPQESVTRRCEV